jgi:pimeloyl-ACP methyl ester carboxylesterase
VGRLRQLERRHRASAARWLHRLRPTHPLEGLAIDTATLADFLHTITGPIVLVGHSYGGEVITNAATGDSQVKALVYDDASLPKQGEDLTDLTTAGSCFAVHDLSTVFTFVPDPRITIRHGRLRQTDRVPRLLRQRPAGPRSP